MAKKADEVKQEKLSDDELQKIIAEKQIKQAEELQNKLRSELNEFLGMTFTEVVDKYYGTQNFPILLEMKQVQYMEELAVLLNQKEDKK